jgi:two-component system alkaline phosphatase synthesis response regulator PhoP
MAESKKTILIIEDDTSLQEALKDALSRGGYACITANDGEVGLQMSLEHKPNLIMLDLLMPKLDGMEMLKKLRQDAWGKNAHVLILTNLSADNSDRVRTIVETAPDFYLVKSDWSINDIVKKTSEILAR